MALEDNWWDWESSVCVILWEEGSSYTHPLFSHSKKEKHTLQRRRKLKTAEDEKKSWRGII